MAISHTASAGLRVAVRNRECSHRIADDLVLQAEDSLIDEASDDALLDFLVGDFVRLQEGLHGGQRRGVSRLLGLG